MSLVMHSRELTDGLYSSGSAQAHHSDTEEGVTTTALDVHPSGPCRAVLTAQSKHLHNKYYNARSRVYTCTQ